MNITTQTQKQYHIALYTRTTDGWIWTVEIDGDSTFVGEEETEEVVS